MKSPVKKRVWVEEIRMNQDLLIGGISALASYSNLSKDRQPTYVINTELYKQLQRNHNLIDENIRYGQIAVEILKYDPKILVINKNIVDPISLYLSLQENEDERIQQALEQMMDELW